MDVDYPGANIYANPRARLAKHVEIPNFELQSLTMQVCYTGLSGISANENGILPSAMTESSSALITRFLRPGETIQSLNLVIREQGQPTGTCGPYVMVRSPPSSSRGSTTYLHLPMV